MAAAVDRDGNFPALIRSAGDKYGYIPARGAADIVSQ
jgi:hypothetical protein